MRNSLGSHQENMACDVLPGNENIIRFCIARAMAGERIPPPHAPPPCRSPGHEKVNFGETLMSCLTS